MKSKIVIASISILIFVAAAIIPVIARFYQQDLFSELLSFSKSTKVYVSTSVEPNMVLFGDEFKIITHVTFDTREFQEDFVRFAIPTEGLIVRNKIFKKEKIGFVVTVTKILQAQCLSCMPDRDYGLGEYVVVLKNKEGLMETFTVGYPRIRVSGRVLDADLKIFPASLRPQKATLFSVKPGMKFVPYLISVGVILSFGAFILLAVTFFTKDKSQPKIVISEQPFSIKIQKEISELLEKLNSGQISAQIVASRIYQILDASEWQNEIYINPEVIYGFKENLLAMVFGPSDKVDVTRLKEVIMQLIDLIKEGADDDN